MEKKHIRQRPHVLLASLMGLEHILRSLFTLLMFMTASKSSSCKVGIKCCNGLEFKGFQGISADSHGFQCADGCTMLHPEKTRDNDLGAVRLSAWRQQSLGAVQAILPCQVGGFGRLTCRSYPSPMDPTDPTDPTEV